MNKKLKNKIRLSPFIFIFLSFLIVIFIGSFLLWLPISQTDNKLSYIDSLFLSTSAICVTGLTPVSNLAEHLNIFGRVILAILIINCDIFLYTTYFFAFNCLIKLCYLQKVKTVLFYSWVVFLMVL